MRTHTRTLLHRNSYTKKTKVFKYTKRQQITQTTQLQKKRPSSSLTADIWDGLWDSKLLDQIQLIGEARVVSCKTKDFLVTQVV